MEGTLIRVLLWPRDFYIVVGGRFAYFFWQHSRASCLSCDDSTDGTTLTLSSSTDAVRLGLLSLRGAESRVCDVFTAG